MLKFYTVKGTARLTSCVGTCLWLLEYINKEHEIITIDIRKGENRKPDFLKLNPNGRIPCINDKGFVLWESIAINYYLAEKYKPEMFGKDIKDKALVYQWTQWMISELLPYVVEIFKNAGRPHDQKDHQYMEMCKHKIMLASTILDNNLKSKSHLVNEMFTLADLHVASIISIHDILHTDLSEYKYLSRWLKSTLDNQALIKVIEKKYISMKIG